jgi:hypothetical protein
MRFMQEENETSGKVGAVIIVVLFFGYVILSMLYDWNILYLYAIVGVGVPLSAKIFNWVYRTR